MGYYGPNGFYELKGPVALRYVAPLAKDEARNCAASCGIERKRRKRCGALQNKKMWQRVTQDKCPFLEGALQA